MQEKIGSVNFSAGRGVGNAVEDYLSNAKKEIWIVSPWISPKYAELLVRKQQRGINVHLITTNDIGNKTHSESLSKLIKHHQTSNTKSKLFALAISFGMAIIFGAFAIELPSLWVLAGLFGLVGFVILLVPLKSSHYDSPIDLTVVDKIENFTHSKIYVTEDIAAVGSANLTESGFWKNIEFIATSRGPKWRDTLKGFFQNIKESELVEKIAIEDLGAKLDIPVEDTPQSEIEQSESKKQK